MGLAGRKVKQRITADPRNLAWADDAAKFGSSYLSKFGWDPSKGLGADGEGRTSHVKVSQKLDMLGIGAAYHNGPNGVSWKQNRDFENVLQRLYETSQQEAPTDPGSSFGAENEGSVCNTANDEELERKKKRKRDKRSDPEDKLRKKPKKNKHVMEPVTSDVEDGNISANPPQSFTPRVRAHRARFIASKSIASKSSASIAEILGLEPAPSTPNTPSMLTPISDDNGPLERLTISTKSVADYFSEKLMKKSLSNSDTLPPLSLDHETDYDDTPKGGIGVLRSQNTILESMAAPQSGISSSMLPSRLTPLSTEFAPQDVPENPLQSSRTKTEKVERKKRSKNKTLSSDEQKRKEKKRREKDVKA